MNPDGGVSVERFLLSMRDLVIEADIDGEWKPIVNGLSMDLHKGEIVGLIGESGAGKSTYGLAAMGYTKPGCRIISGSIVLEGEELVGASPSRLREIRGNSVSYVAQSAAAAFNPAHRLIEQFVEAPVQHGRCVQRTPHAAVRTSTGNWTFLIRIISATAFRIRFRAVSCSAQ